MEYNKEIIKQDDFRRRHSNEITNVYSLQKQNVCTESNSPILASNAPVTSPRCHIDPQTYVDAQSSGLTFRAIRYHEESNKNSKICNRMYKRPSDFPIVHLEKSKSILNLRKSVVHQPKIAKIGHPDSSIYRTSMRSEILRNGTLMPQMLVRRSEDLDNERGLDPLDALKEISRKRIHCEETNSNQKRIESITKDSTDSLISSVISKRQRITTSPNSFSADETNKKRHCSTKNNDIISSLSSSSHMLPSPKRQEINSSYTSLGLLQAKRLQYESSISPSKIDLPINSITKTVDDTSATSIQIPHPVEHQKAPPKLSLFNRAYQQFVPPSTMDGNESDDDCRIAFVKPKQTLGLTKEGISNLLKLKPVEKTKLSLMLSCLSGELDDEDTVDSKENRSDSSTINFTTAVEEKQSENHLKRIENKIDAKIDGTLATTSSVNESNISETVKFATKIAEKEVNTSKFSEVEQRKGGFSFPVTPSVKPASLLPIGTPAVTTNITPAVINVTPAVTTTVTPALTTTVTPALTTTVTPALTTTVTPALTTTVTPAFTTTVTPALTTTVTPALTTTVTPALTTTVTPAVTTTVTLPLKTNAVSLPKETISHTGHMKTFGIQVSNISPPAAESTKNFTFGNINTNEMKTSASLGSTNIPSLSQKTLNTTKDASVEQRKSVESRNLVKPFAFSQTPIQTMPSSSSLLPPSTTSIYGTTPTTNSLSLSTKEQSSIGSAVISTFSLTAQQPTSSATSLSYNKDQSSLTTSGFSNNTYQPVFGSTSSSVSIHSNEPKMFDMKTPKAVGFSLTSVQSPKPNTSVTNSTLTFGATISPTIHTAPLTQSIVFGVGKNVDKSPNLFGTSQSTRGSSTTSLFEPIVEVKSNMFNQAMKNDSKNTLFPNRNTEPERSVVTTQNIFTSSVVNPSSTFSFGQPPKTNNIFGAPTSSNLFNFGGSTQISGISASKSGDDTTKRFTFGESIGEAPSVAFGSKPGVTTFGSPSISDTAKVFGFATNNQTSSSNLFSKTTNDVPKIFSFSGSNNTPTFGGSLTSFSSSNTSTTPVFGGNFGTPSFGGSNITQTFGGGNVGPNFTSNVGTIISTQALSGSFNVNPAFTTSTASADANKTFNFTGSDSVPSPIPNLFNIGPVSNTATRGRNIRTAVRRNNR